MSLKKIPSSQLRVGMFVHSFGGSWLQHPFWSSRMLVANPDILQTIMTSGIRDLVIDTSRGLDVESEQGADGPATVTVAPAQAGETVLAASSLVDTLPETVGLQEEMRRARKIFSGAKLKVTRMFQDVRLGRTLETEGLVELIDDISGSLQRNPHALLSMARIKSRDEYTYLHSVAVAALMAGLARQHGLPEEQVRIAGMAGLLHDMGKALTPEAILNKPGKLTDEEFAVMREHPRQGWELLRGLPGVPDEVLDVCLHHHEKMDGTGYPDVLPAERISLLSRMGAICDVYDAITSNRPYKSGWDPAVSLSRMASWEGHFDRLLLQKFVTLLGIYPVGSLVRLESQRLAVVVEQNPQALLKPVVSVFYSIRLRQQVPVQRMDLAQANCVDRIVAREQPEDWNIRNLEKLWMPA